MQDFYGNRVFLHSGTSTQVQDRSTSTFTQVQVLSTSTFTQVQDLSTSTFTQVQVLSTSPTSVSNNSVDVDLVCVLEAVS